MASLFAGCWPHTKVYRFLFSHFPPPTRIHMTIRGTSMFYCDLAIVATVTHSGDRLLTPAGPIRVLSWNFSTWNWRSLILVFSSGRSYKMASLVNYQWLYFLSCRKNVSVRTKKPDVESLSIIPVSSLFFHSVNIFWMLLCFKHWSSHSWGSFTSLLSYQLSRCYPVIDSVSNKNPFSLKLEQVDFCHLQPKSYITIPHSLISLQPHWIAGSSLNKSCFSG